MNRYKLFLFMLVISLFMLSIFYFCFIFVFIHFTSFEFVSEKNSLLTQTYNQPRIIIESGSNSYHGINSKLLEDHFGKLTINISDNAGVTIKSKLYRINKFAKKGDIVIMPLEYIYYTDHDTVDVFYDSLFFEANHYFKYLPFYEKVKIVFEIPASTIINAFYRSYKSEFFTKKYIKHFLMGSKKEENKVLASIKDGYRGDFKFVDKVVFSPEKLNLPCQRYIFTKKDDKKPKIGDMFKSNLKLIKKIEKDKGIEFIFTYPTVGGDGCYNDSSQYGKNFIQFIKDIKNYILDNGIEFIGDYNDSYFSQDLLHDTWFHVVPEARDIRTHRLIRSLEKIKI